MGVKVKEILSEEERARRAYKEAGIDIADFKETRRQKIARGIRSAQYKARQKAKERAKKLPSQIKKAAQKERRRKRRRRRSTELRPYQFGVGLNLPSGKRRSGYDLGVGLNLPKPRRKSRRRKKKR